MSDQTRYIVLTTRKPEDTAVKLDEYDEIGFVFANFISGPIKAISSRGDGPGTVIELAVATEEEALAFAKDLPAVKAGIEKALVIPLRAYAPFVALAEAWD